MIHFNPESRFVVLLLTAVLFSGTACRQQPQKQTGQPEKITIAYTSTTGGALVHIAFAKDYFAQEGLDMTPQLHLFGKQALHAVIEGKADLATVADTPIMFAVINGKPITTLAVIQTSNRNTGIVARRDWGISKPSDLKGKTIGVTRGTVNEYFAEVFLEFHGIHRKQVKIVDLMPDEMAAAVKAGKVDAVSIWNPIQTKLQQDLGSKGLTFYGETLYTEAFCAVARQDFVKQHPDAVRKFLRALIKAEAFVKQHPEESRRLVAAFIKTDKSLLDRIWDVYKFGVSLDQSFLINIEEQTQRALQNRLTGYREMPNYLDFIYVEGLQAVRIIR